MKSFLSVSAFLMVGSCAQHTETTHTENESDVVGCQTEAETKTPPHRYGGWYCPDNLHGFPAVNLADWNQVPVIHDRLPTEEEVQTESSLILVDTEAYPDAHALAIKMPKLATFQSPYTNREEIIIVIQAIYVSGDSIVGFRYLNGGNGSARINEVNFLSDDEIAQIPSYQFAHASIEIDAKQEDIWSVLREEEYLATLEPTFNQNKTLPEIWRANTNVNYAYANSGAPTAQYGELLFGCYYIQNDYENHYFTEKFWMLENEETGKTTLEIVCGPILNDLSSEQKKIDAFAKEVKKLVEK